MSETFHKLLLIGDSGVGKSCMLQRFVDDRFTEAFYNTIGVDFKTKTIHIDGEVQKLQIWDTAGQERFRTITANYYKGAHGILVVFDLTDEQSLKDVAFWLEEIDKHGNLHPSIILIGNKADKADKRQVSEDQGLEFAKKHGLDYIECSAFNALNINLVFEAIIKKVRRERVKKDDGLAEPQNKQGQGPSKKLNQRSNKARKEQSGCC